MKSSNFSHQQSAHCESGVIAALLRHAGLPISEAMAFGLSGAIVFAYIPVVRLGGLPLISYRMPPGRIVKGLSSRLGVQMKSQRFREPTDSLSALRKLLAQEKVVGMQTSVYWLPYFPEEMRFHFNAHNLIVYGESSEGFLVSDPILEAPTHIDEASLLKARFARGALAPKGLQYYPAELPANLNFAPLIKPAIRRNAQMMLRSPIPIAGVSGIAYVSKLVAKLAKGDPDQGKLFVGHMVRMQEEIGTGGGGFRFLYAAFLQEAAALLGNDGLAQSSTQFTDVGDEWRRFALYVAKMIKGRKELDFGLLADQLQRVAEQERAAWCELNAVATSL